MASDEDEDLLALREAALATMKKKPAAVEDVQPIPQLTSSSHSLNNAMPSWPEDIFPFNDHIPFQDHQPTAAFPPSSAPPPQPQLQFGQPPPVQFRPNWRGPRPGRGSGAQGNSNQFAQSRGRFPSNRGPRFGRNKRPPFGQRMPFLPNQRLPFPQHQQVLFNPSRPPPPFGQNPVPLMGLPPQGGGDLGNLIVINTVPEGGEPAPGNPGPRPLFPVADSPRGRGGGHGGTGRGEDRGNMGHGGNLPPVESSSKPMLLRPQDKYCRPADSAGAVQEESKEPVHRKKKDKFSRYNSSDDDSDDESEEESENELPSRRHSVGGREVEEKETVESEDLKEEATAQSQFHRDIPDTELSIVAMNTSQLDSDHDEHAEPELDEPVIDNLGEPVIDSIGDGGQVSEAELNEEEEDKLLASPSRQSDSGLSRRDRYDRQRSSSENNDTPVRDESPVRDDSLIERTSPAGSETPVRDESFDDTDATPVRDESPERDSSPEQAESQGNKDSDQDKSPCSSQVEGGDQSDSDEGSENGDDSDSSSDTSSSASSSGKEDASKSSSGSASNDSEAKKAEEPPSDKYSDSDVQIAAVVSDSESNEDRPVRRLPSKRRHSASSRVKRSSHTHPRVTLTPEQQAKMEARRRKFESRQEVKVTENKRTISLKVTGSVTSTPNDKRGSDKAVKNSQTAKSSSRTVQTKVSASKSNDTDFHHKHSRRKVSIEKTVHGKLDSNSEAENRSESQEEDDDDDDDGRSRSWMREANRNAVHRKTVISKSHPDSDSFRGHSYRGGNRNGGYYRRDRESLKDSRPEVHYSSSDHEEQDSDRKLISIVVPRAAAGTHHGYNRSKQEQNSARSVVPNRKRTSDSARFDRGDSDRHGRSKSKRLQDFSPQNDRSGVINVVISGDHSSSKASQPGVGRIPVHQRLGKGKKQHTGSSRSWSTSRPAARNPSDSASGDEGNGNELDQRIRVIQRKNKAIMRRQKEVLKDRELYG